MCFYLSEQEAATLAERGALRIGAALDARSLAELGAAIAAWQPGHAGVRLQGVPALRSFLVPTGPVGRLAAAALGDASRPVRAIFFDKTAASNWSVPWHQDRTIVVARRREVAGFGPWTIKSGLLHVASPYDVLADMVTLRVHLDAVPDSNAPLLIAPGSHRLGRIAETDVRSVVRRCGTAVCCAEAGDVWLYATPILHASEAAAEPAHRRVLQVDFASRALPGGLEWLGI
jgi:Phytanoyl-CoA dioxygenase (PhyH)